MLATLSHVMMIRKEREKNSHTKRQNNFEFPKSAHKVTHLFLLINLRGIILSRNKSVWKDVEEQTIPKIHPPNTELLPEQRRDKIALGWRIIWFALFFCVVDFFFCFIFRVLAAFLSKQSIKHAFFHRYIYIHGSIMLLLHISL